MSELSILKYGLLIFCAISIVVIGWSYVKQGRLKGWAQLFLLGVVGAGLLMLDSFVIEPNWIQVHSVKITNPALAQSLRGLKVVHISDIHLTEGIRFRERQLIKKMNALEPDIIFITGDFLDDLSQLEPTKALIKQLKAKIGIYAVPGNTDHIVMDSYSLKRELEPLGIHVFINENKRVSLPNDQAIWLVGIDDPKYHFGNLQKSLENIYSDEPRILLAHSPEIYDHLGSASFDLILAGDTHGGQVGIPFLVRMSDYANRTPYIRGLFKSKGIPMYVNRGIGMKTIPIRFLCRPEIAVLEVTS